MSDKDIVPLSSIGPNNFSLSLNGTPTRIDLKTGHTFDQAGNDTGKWTPMDGDGKKIEQSNRTLAAYAARYSAHVTGCSLAGAGRSENPEAIRDTAQQFWNLSVASPEERDSLLELGVRPQGQSRRQRAKVEKEAARQQALSLIPMLEKASPEEKQQLLALGLENARLQGLDLAPSDVHIQQALPNFVTGYRNFGPVADVVSPCIMVDHKSDKYYQYSHLDAFERGMPILGAAGAQIPEVTPQFGNSSYTAIERAVGGFLSTETQGNQDVVLRLQQAIVRRMINVQMIEREFRVQSLVRTSGNWNAATTLGAGAQWNGGASSDPVKDIQTVMDTSLGEVTGAIIPGHIWRAMTRNPAVRSYYTYSGSNPGVLKDSEMTALLKLPEIYVANMKYIDTSGNPKYVWGNDVILFSRATSIPPMNQEEVATSYTFRWTMSNVSVPDSAAVGFDGLNGRGFVLRQFYNQIRGALGGIQMVLVAADAEKQTSAYIGNLLINAYQ